VRAASVSNDAPRSGESGAPIFILGLQRGGTNQLLNVLRSHPDTCWPHGELHEVLRPRASVTGSTAQNARRFLAYLPVLLASGDILSPHRPPPPVALAGRRGKWVTAELARATRANERRVRDYKAALARHGFLPDGVSRPHRMVVKVVNYNVGLAPELARLYPGATFVGLIRDAVGVCEGRTARGGDLEAATAAYNYVGQQLAALESAGAAIRTFRFEDLVRNTEAVARSVYALCRLDPAGTLGLCLQDKERLHDPAGTVVGARVTEAFYRFGDVRRHMRQDPNAGALSRLSEEARATIRERCMPALKHFGYL
jgi:hypothetical protein